MPIAPPFAATCPHIRQHHGHDRADPYAWLEDPEDPAVIAHLEAENAYSAAVLAGAADLREALYREMVGRVRDDDETPPVFDHGYWWYRRYEAGREHALHCRRKETLTAPEEVVLDVNVVAGERPGCSVTDLTCSDDARYLAYTIDPEGDRRCELRFRDLERGEDLDDRIDDVDAGGAVWAADHRTCLYVRIDPETLRPYRVYRHRLGEPVAQDRLVYEEDDTTFEVGVGRSRSRRLLLIHSGQTICDEVRWLPAEDPDREPTVVVARERGHEYQVDHHGDHLYLLTNRLGPNQGLVRCPLEATAPEDWETVVPHRDDTLLEGFELFDGHLVLDERSEAVTRIRVRRRSDGHERLVPSDEPVHALWIHANPRADTTTLRYAETSLTTPATIYDLDMATFERRLVKRFDFAGDYDPADYVAHREWAVADDGTRIPISLVHHRSRPIDRPGPLLVAAYGAYGMSFDPHCGSSVVSLLDRGVAFAIAHVRGGQECGRAWYDQGRLEHKPNSFDDFIACADHLVAGGWTTPQQLAIEGGSAGGLLVGAVLNRRPDLCRVAVAQVPFVDIVTTMFDDHLPLTTFEYDEWGDPREERWYRTMLAYSPYDNVGPGPYPVVFATTGINDTNVRYHEPAKWIARLRAEAAGGPFLLHCEMDVGHGGKVGRYRQYEDAAREQACVLWALAADGDDLRLSAGGQHQHPPA